MIVADTLDPVRPITPGEIREARDRIADVDLPKFCSIICPADGKA
jgi:hypothetical protein